eukprot:scaffold16733_cov55-Phaeocystis_antarctica.AAC.4
MPPGKVAHHPGWKPLQGSATTMSQARLHARAGSPGPLRAPENVVRVNPFQARTCVQGNSVCGAIQCAGKMCRGHLWVGAKIKSQKPVCERTNAGVGEMRVNHQDASRAVLDKAIYNKIPGTTHATIFPGKLDDA